MDIYVKGFFYSNLGDDLFLHILARRYKEHRFHVVINDEYNNSFADEENVVVHDYKKYHRGIDKLLVHIHMDYCSIVERMCELNVIISGSIFQEGENDRMAMARLKMLPCHNRTYIIGVNFGPYVTKNYYSSTKKYLQYAEDVCFRDEWSYNLFSDMKNVRVAPDIVFGAGKLVAKSDKSNKVVFVSLVDVKSKHNIAAYEKKYIQFIVDYVVKCAKEGYRIILSSFCKMEGDETAVSTVLNELPKDVFKMTEPLFYNGRNWDELLKCIQMSEKVIATRFHSMILAMVYKVPVLPIVYNDKIRRFLDYIGKNEAGIAMAELENYQISEKDFVIVDNIDTLQMSSEKQFEKLDTTLHI